MTTRAAFALAFVLGWLPDPAGAQGTQRTERRFWEEMYGRLGAGEEPLVERAQTVLGRLLQQTADRFTVPPELLVLRDARQPRMALALPDQTIVLSRQGLAFCYQDDSTGRRQADSRALRTGDTRLALVLAHEIGHLLREDGWHLAAFTDSLPADASGARAALEVARADELRADSDAVLLLLAAGFEPRFVLEPPRFLDEWASQELRQGPRRTAGHPQIGERVTAMRRRLTTVEEAAPFYESGVSLFQAGRAAPALAAFEEFQRRTRYEGRELLSNLGACHYQLAWQALRRCGSPEAVRFRLTPTVDDVSPAGRVHLRGSDACRTARTASTRLNEAVTLLRRAAAADPRYAPARLNLASALILAGDAHSAVDEIRRADAIRDTPGAGAPAKRLTAQVRSLRGVAEYLVGADAGARPDRPRQLMESLAQEMPRDPVVAYNLARLLHETGSTPEAAAAWARFLALEKDGPYADAARLALSSLGVAADPAAAPGAH